MKKSFSWSKPDGIPRLIARKQVDKSMLLTGSHIPKDFHEDFAAANNGDLPAVGQTKKVTLVVGAAEHEARLVNQPHHGPDSTDLSILYSSAGSFGTLIKRQLSFSYRRFVIDPEPNPEPDMIPESEREYVEFYDTGTPYRYEVRFVQASSVGAELPMPPKDFSRVWTDLENLLRGTPTVRTLAQGLPNKVTWTVNGIRVTTERGSEIIPKSSFEAAWDSLTQKGIVAADELPREARFRSTAILSIIADLPYVEYTTHPKTKLFLTSHRFTNQELSETFKVGTQRGIRVAGRAPDTKLVVFITGDASDYNVEHPYRDRWDGDTFYYTGEGLIGDQELRHGNLALQRSIQGQFPVYGFRKLSAGGYAYLGRFRVKEVHEEHQLDTEGNLRRVYIFEMTREGHKPTPGISGTKSWVFQANPKYYRLSDALKSLDEIPFLVNQYASEIKPGDRVYFWEAGPNAGLIGVGTVTIEPTEMLDHEASRPFYVSPEMFDGQKLRTIVKVDQVIAPPILRQNFLDHPLLRNLTVLTLRAGTNFRVTPEQDAAIRDLISRERTPKYFRIAAPKDPTDWEYCQNNNCILLNGTAPTCDLRTLPNQAAIDGALIAEVSPLPSFAHRRTEELTTILALTTGDKLIVTQGSSTVVGLAEVEAPGYEWNPNLSHHTIKVKWHWLGWLRVPRHPEWLTRLISPANETEYQEILSCQGPKSVPASDLAQVTRSFSEALQLSGIHFGGRHEEVVRSFVAALATKRLVILTGLSGSGKTQIALKFGDWLGKERRMVVPVRPDWTGPDYLFGYEDALKPMVKDRRPWYVPPVLAFMLKAAHDPHYPYLLVLDEMNLAHVERYFADFLSGMESGEPCLPNLVQNEAGQWVIPEDAKCERIPIPENLFVVGTVNIDETTYMFSPKVLDRANTFEFRVETDDLQITLRKPLPVEPGPEDLVRGFLAAAADDEWQQYHPHPNQDQFADQLRTVHRLLSTSDFEFGHRVFYEALRYASMLAATGNSSLEDALDQQIYQKILPRIHGSRRRLEPLLRALAAYCCDMRYSPSENSSSFDPESPQNNQPKLPLSYEKIRRMFRSLRVNQFTSFTE